MLGVNGLFLGGAHNYSYGGLVMAWPYKECIACDCFSCRKWEECDPCHSCIWACRESVPTTLCKDYEPREEKAGGCKPCSNKS